MNKDEFLYRIRCLLGQVEYMSDREFNSCFKDDMIKFHHTIYSEALWKIDTEIYMKKTNGQKERIL